jgi:hypothetical protein
VSGSVRSTLARLTPAFMAITIMLRTLALLTDITGRSGSPAAYSSAPDPGIANTMAALDTMAARLCDVTLTTAGMDLAIAIMIATSAAGISMAVIFMGMIFAAETSMGAVSRARARAAATSMGRASRAEGHAVAAFTAANRVAEADPMEAGAGKVMSQVIHG